MLTTIKGITILVIATMEHFLNILKNGITNRNTAVNKFMEMVVKNLL